MRFICSLFAYWFNLPVGHFQFYTLITLWSTLIIPFARDLNNNKKLNKLKKLKNLKKMKAKDEEIKKMKEELKKYIDNEINKKEAAKNPDRDDRN